MLMTLLHTCKLCLAATIVIYLCIFLFYLWHYLMNVKIISKISRRTSVPRNIGPAPPLLHCHLWMFHVCVNVLKVSAQSLGPSIDLWYIYTDGGFLIHVHTKLLSGTMLKVSTQSLGPSGDLWYIYTRGGFSYMYTQSGYFGHSVMCWRSPCLWDPVETCGRATHVRVFHICTHKTGIWDLDTFTSAWKTPANVQMCWTTLHGPKDLLHPCTYQQICLLGCETWKYQEAEWGPMSFSPRWE